MAARLLPPTTGAPDAAMLARPGVAKIWQAARDFEAMALGQFLAPMFDTVDTAKSVFGGGAGESAWRPMLVQQMARQVAAHGGLGLAMPVFRQGLRLKDHPQKEPA